MITLSFLLPLTTYERDYKGLLEQVSPQIVGFFGQFAQQYDKVSQAEFLNTLPIHPYNHKKSCLEPLCGVGL